MGKIGKFEIGRKYYGINPGISASWVDFTILHEIVGGNTRQAVMVVTDTDGHQEFKEHFQGERSLSVLYDGALDSFYQETPWVREYKVGDKITTEYTGNAILYYQLEHRGYGMELGETYPGWYARRYDADGDIMPVFLRDDRITGLYED